LGGVLKTIGKHLCIGRPATGFLLFLIYSFGKKVDLIYDFLIVDL